MGGKDDDEFGLNLSLSLGSSSSCPDKQNPPPPFPLNLMLSSSSSFQNAPFNFNPPASQSSSDRNVVPQLNVGGTDVNLPAITADGEEEMVVSSPNSTVSSVSHGKRSAEKEENEAEDDGGDAAERKKLRLSKEQSAMLEETFKEYNSLNQKQKVDLAKELNLRPRQVEVWFQNRRARTKLKQTEVDCDYLRRCCESLTKENKRLQKEVSELRALKLVSPQFYMNMSPPTTLTMCPQCERVVVSSSISSASACSSLPTLGIVSSGSPAPSADARRRPVAGHAFSQATQHEDIIIVNM